MDLKHIEKLMAAMGRLGTTRLVIKKDDFELQLERAGENISRIQEPLTLAEEQLLREGQILRRADYGLAKGGHGATAPSQHRPAAPETHSEGHVENKIAAIKSPMVGTFYSASSPESPPFIRVGDVVEEDTVVCIIEAMKVMNEIKAGIAGKVAEVLVDNGHPVEFGTPLYRIV